MYLVALRGEMSSGSIQIYIIMHKSNKKLTALKPYLKEGKHLVCTSKKEIFFKPGKNNINDTSSDVYAEKS